MKKILLLGGSTQQIPAIEYAKEQGYYTVLCDFLPDNPGQYHADKFYCVSTTDKEAILKVSRNESVDGIVAYASDPAAPIAAFVAETLGLPTNPYHSIEILAYKDNFRKYLKENNFSCPYAESFLKFEELENKIHKFRFPVIVKPIDSSGSKGVTRVDSTKELKEAFLHAQINSRSKKIIVEEFIVQDHPYMIAGDCFVINGKVEFWGLLNSHRDLNVNPFVPVGTSYPILISEKRLAIVKKNIQKLIDSLEIKFGAFNIEIMFDKDDNMYFIELGPRNGGNMIPDLIYMATDVNMIAATIDVAMGKRYFFPEECSKGVFIATHVIHSSENGILNEVKFADSLKDKILKKVFYKKIGDEVQYFDGSNKAIGILFLKFENREEMLEFMEQPKKWISISVT